MGRNGSATVFLGYQSLSALPLIERKNRCGTRKFGISDFQHGSPHLYVSTVHNDRRSPYTISLERHPLEGYPCFLHSPLRSLALPIINDPQLGRCNNHLRHGKLLPTSSSDCSLPAHDSHIDNPAYGEVREWPNRAVSKTAVGVTRPWVRSPPSPPYRTSCDPPALHRCIVMLSPTRPAAAPPSPACLACSMRVTIP